MAMKLTVYLGVKQSLRDLMINHLNLYIKPSFKFSTEKAMSCNNSRLESVLKRMKETLFSETVGTKTSAGHIGPDAQSKTTGDEEEII